MPVRGPRPHDPLRAHLVEVRRGLLRLHKSLIDSERRVFEQQAGAQSNMQLLQALIDDPFFAWLRPFSGLIAEIDAGLSEDEPVTPDAARAYLVRAAGLVAPPEDGRFAEVRRRDAGVLFAATELHRQIAAALLYLDEEPAR